MPNPALADCQKSVREECSSRLYQVPIMRTKPGEIVHSKKPCKARIAMSWAQFCAAETEMTQMPVESFVRYCLVE